mmetsp:Transcript_8420/g.12337  ORF Transcript_8420/g.12337 Transcript_8420/m.12337 type:complete len:652 (+) Transcript_8420:230-2185(+)
MSHVTVIGIGAMGGGIARTMLTSPTTQTVIGYDQNMELVQSFHNEALSVGKALLASNDDTNHPPKRLSEAITSNTDVVILVLVNEGQCDSVCFGGGGENVLGLLKEGSCVILCSTVTATWAINASTQFQTKNIHFVDCPISGGPARAATGDLSIFASGDAASLDVAMPLLKAAGKEVHIVPGGVGMGSTVKMVHQLLAGVHIAAAAEALALAAKAGIDVNQMYKIVNGAAGASWMFGDRGTRMIDSTNTEVKSALGIFVKDLDIVYSEAKKKMSPTPLASAALQQFICGAGMGLGRKDDSQVVKVYERITGAPVGGSGSGGGKTAASEEVEKGVKKNVTVIGIGAMGGGIARSILSCEEACTVVGYDRSKELMVNFHKEAIAVGKGASTTALPTELDQAVTKKTDVVVIVLVNEAQCEDVCFGGEGKGTNLLTCLQEGSCVILCSTVSATWTRKACKQFQSKGILFVDSPISGGPARAKTGDLSMFVSGDDSSLRVAMPILKSAGRHEEVHIIEGGAGMGSTVKMVHQLLAGVHIACAAEALALAAKAGVDVEQMYDIVNGAAGASWMFTDRGKRMIGSTEPEVKSALSIFVKDLDIVYSEAKALQSPIPIASVALQQFINGVGLGLAMKDDSQVVKVYESVTNIPVGKWS